MIVGIKYNIKTFNFMDKKKLLLIVGGGVILVAVILIISSLSTKVNPSDGGGGSNGFVQSLIFAKGEDANKNPIDPVEYFSVNDPEFHATIKFAGLPVGSVISYQWYSLTKNKSLKDEAKPVLKAAFTGSSSSVLTRNEEQKVWDVDTIEFRILLNGKVYFAKRFEVETDQQIQQNKILAGIKNIQLTSAVDLQGKPLKASNGIFSKDDPDIFASVTYENIPTKITMQARWTYIAEERVINTYSKDLVGSGTFAFGINAKKDSWLPILKWAVGKYKLDIYLNGISGTPFKTFEFEVQ